MLVEDPQNRDVFPDKNNTVITESGKQVEILDISRQIAPPSVVLVLDSSGSMGSHMAATIESAKKFINGLPDKTYIKVIDFDSTVRVLKGDTKDAVIKISHL
jgi:Mg-chelatase subunit ChlD